MCLLTFAIVGGAEKELKREIRFCVNAHVSLAGGHVHALLLSL